MSSETEQSIDSLMEIAGNATAGPWKRGREGYDHVVRSEYGLVAIAMEAIPGAAFGNMVFMASFDPPTVLRLLRAAKRFEAAQAPWQKLQDVGQDLPSFDLEPMKFQATMDKRREAIAELAKAFAPEADPE